jgi:sulfur-oxidizing protein SoxY
MEVGTVTPSGTGLPRQAWEEIDHMTTSTLSTSRREFLALTAGAAALAVPGSLAIIPSTSASAASALATEAIAKIVGSAKVSEGRIKLDLPSIAENGLVVPLNFEVESPMTDADYVKVIHFFADENPTPQVASFQFTPMAPKAAAAIRIRLAKSQNIVAIAEMSNGQFYTAKKEVKVTIGGCGG